MHSADDLVMCLGDFNGRAGRHIDGFHGVHRRCSVGQRNFERKMLPRIRLEKELCVKMHVLREEKRKVTFRLRENETKIDCVDKKRRLVLITKCEGICRGFNMY